ncbi:uncharacterized protein DUF4269 [Dysgonomonas alginatilytica]|uniref:Uncharacterized protein DUF4269 n=1 Tax=Dysgonomonas alginatilytica TaxID=1605892 RepID=A0A2V3PRV9_9BACT|nr:DUF4269 domain-containing protein [Dysgonomonas alginatilytica]PXV65542.1 uncharacterized protein DUF4269 [Dysgonomonas alginatilytica]
MIFYDIGYLKEGNSRQQHCYKVLRETNILEILHSYNPVVVGTIPIAIDIEGSDIDVACCTENLLEFRDIVRFNFSSFKDFSDHLENVYIANFEYRGLEIEIYGEPVPTFMQNGYRHMLIEDRILRLAGAKFRDDIIALKRQGYKTEPAFGILLKLKDPYQELLNLVQLDDDELMSFVAQALQNK